MDRFDPSLLIKGSEKITCIFGYWPSFHDAEILEVGMTIADGEPWVPDSESPVMDVKIHVFEMTKNITPDGYFVLDKHTLAHLRFRNIEDVELLGFWYQNCIFELEFTAETVSRRQGHPEENPVNFLKVEINSSVGLSGGFRCQSAEVVSAEPCDENGAPTRRAD